jgi:hypothetical protein
MVITKENQNLTQRVTSLWLENKKWSEATSRTEPLLRLASGLK